MSRCEVVRLMVAHGPAKKLFEGAVLHDPAASSTVNRAGKANHPRLFLLRASPLFRAA